MKTYESISSVLCPSTWSELLTTLEKKAVYKRKTSQNLQEQKPACVWWKNLRCCSHDAVMDIWNFATHEQELRLSAKPLVRPRTFVPAAARAGGIKQGIDGTGATGKEQPVVEPARKRRKPLLTAPKRPSGIGVGVDTISEQELARAVAREFVPVSAMVQDYLIERTMISFEEL